MFDVEMVLFQRHNPSINESLVGRVSFQPEQGLIVHSQRDFTWAQVTVILYYKVVCGVHLQLGCSVLRLSDSQFFATINNQAQESFSWWALPLMKYAGDGHGTGIGIQYELAFGVRLRECSCVNECFFDFLESQLLFGPPHERGVDASDGM